MVAGLRRLSDPRAVSSLAAASKATKKKLTQATVKVVNGAVCVKATKTVASAARDSLGAILDEGMADLNKYLLEHPERILVTLRIVKDDAYYRIQKNPMSSGFTQRLYIFLACRNNSGSNFCWTTVQPQSLMPHGVNLF